MEKEICKVCGGRGFIEKQFKTFVDNLTNNGMSQCPFCEGWGFIITQGKSDKENRGLTNKNR